MKLFKLFFIAISLIAFGNALAGIGITDDFQLPEVLAVILGIFAPIVVQWVNRKVQHKIYRFWISVLFSLITGFVAALITGHLYPSPETVLWVFFAAQAAYHTYWEVIWKKPENREIWKSYK